MLFMQNGTIAHFTKIRVEILEEIKYTTASMIEVRSWPSWLLMPPGADLTSCMWPSNIRE
jgi:hypothetical protein